jgi:peptidyl-prolyl cis-trans isomerase SurA
MGLLIGASARGRMIDRVVAVVNQQPILLSEVDALCQFQLEEVPATLPLDEAVERKRQIRLETLQTLIDERLLAQTVRERKIEIPEEKIEQYIEQLRKDNNLTAEQFRAALEAEGKSMAQYRRMLREMFEKRALMQRELQGKAVVSEQDIQDYYRQHYVGGAGAEKIKASHA